MHVFAVYRGLTLFFNIYKINLMCMLYNNHIVTVKVSITVSASL